MGGGQGGSRRAGPVLYAAVRDWMARDWPFHSVDYAPRPRPCTCQRLVRAVTRGGESSGFRRARHPSIGPDRPRPSRGARVIAVVSSTEKVAIAEAAGAHHVVLADGFAAEVRQLADGRGVDVIVDPVGGERFTESLRSLARGGRLLVVGFAGGEIPVVKTNRLLLTNTTVMGAATRELWNHRAGNASMAVERTDATAEVRCPGPGHRCAILDRTDWIGYPNDRGTSRRR